MQQLPGRGKSDTSSCSSLSLSVLIQWPYGVSCLEYVVILPGDSLECRPSSAASAYKGSPMAPACVQTSHFPALRYSFEVLSSPTSSFEFVHLQELYLSTFTFTSTMEASSMVFRCGCGMWVYGSGGNYH